MAPICLVALMSVLTVSVGLTTTSLQKCEDPSDDQSLLQVKSEVKKGRASRHTTTPTELNEDKQQKLQAERDAEKARQVVGMAVLVAASREATKGNKTRGDSKWCVLQCGIAKDAEACAACGSSPKQSEKAWLRSVLNDETADENSLQKLFEVSEANKQERK